LTIVRIKKKKHKNMVRNGITAQGQYSLLWKSRGIT
jgi:hypothetical protein